MQYRMEGFAAAENKEIKMKIDYEAPFLKNHEKD